MNLEDLIKAFDEALFDTNKERAMALAREALDQGLDAEQLVHGVIVHALDRQSCQPGAGQELNLAQHFLASEIAFEVTAEVQKHFKHQMGAAGRVIIGTAHGDLHTLGKRLVIGCLRAHLIDCHDLGVNVPAERFVDEALARDAAVIAISAMMVHTARGENGSLRVREVLRHRGLEERIKVVVGGAPFRYDPELYKQVGADDWADDAIKAGPLIARILREAGK